MLTKSKIHRGLMATAGIAVAPFVSVSPVYAQQDTMRLEEVVVMARKRSESLQDVPVAVTALSAGQIERGIITSVVDLKKLAPLLANPEGPIFIDAKVNVDVIAPFITEFTHKDEKKK